jgi:hypothetical protein
MKARLVKSCEVFDVAHHRVRQPRTLVSLKIDGRQYLSLELPGIQNPNSGANVPFMFSNSEEKKIAGWIDPKSQALYIVNGWNPWLMVIPAGFAVLVVMHLLALIGTTPIFLMPMGGLLFMLALGFVVRKHTHHWQLEVRLRQLLECKQDHDPQPGSQQDAAR